MRFHHYLILLAVGVASTASAATNFTYQKTIFAGTGSAHGGRFTGMVGGPDGSLFIVSSSLDSFAYMPDPVNDSYTSISVATTGDFSPGNSFEGVTVTPNGTAYAGGKAPSSDSSKTEYTKGVPNSSPATSFTPTVLDLVTGLHTGPTAVNNNTFVVGASVDGALTFIQNSSDAAFTILNPSPIAGGAAGAKSIVYDSVGGKLYQAASGSQSGIVQSFTSNGTVAGTSTGTNYKAGVSTTLAATDQGIRYQSIAVSTVARLLAVAQNPGPSPAGGTGWAIYDLTNGNQIDFINLSSSDVPGGTALTGALSTPAQQAQGCAFIEKGGSTYLVLGAGSGSTAAGATPTATTSRAYIFKKTNANVSDWSMY